MQSPVTRAAPRRPPEPPKAAPSPPAQQPSPVPTLPETPAPARPDDGNTDAAAIESTAAAAISMTTSPTRAPLRLDLPTSGTSRAPLSRPSNAATSDPRSNSPHLSPSERFAISLGTLDCVVDERQPDGTVRRFEGKFKRGPTASASADPFGHGGGSGGSITGDFSRGLGGGSAGQGGSSYASCVKK